jgi:formamidopyrimidine-DNA glycosylase
MPELPEVETTVNELRPHIVNRRIVSVEVPAPKTIEMPCPEEFIRGLTGRLISGLSRRGKHLLLKLDNGQILIIHLRMTGSLLIKKPSDVPEKFVRVIIRFDNGTALHFRDVRRFGRMWLVDDERKVTGELGPEPLSSEFTPSVLAGILKGRQTPIKSLLLNQSYIAGIGNMYADEALHYARLHPVRRADSLNQKEIAALHEGIQYVLRKGISSKGASTDTYFRPSGSKGAAHLEFQVAHRKGEKCPVCAGVIARITVQQRGTFFCPHCQKIQESRNITIKVPD